MTTTDDHQVAAAVHRAHRLGDNWVLGSTVLIGALPSSTDELVLPAQALVDEDEPVRSLIAVHAQQRGVPVGRHAASLAFQRYCHRYAALTAIVLADTGLALDLSAPRCTTLVHAGSPRAIVLDDMLCAGRGVDDALESLLDRHLLPLARRICALTGPGMGNLWGNIAASLALGLKAVSRQRDSRRILDLGQDLMASRRELERSGNLRILGEGTQSMVFYDRATCCHWDAVPDGKLCSWCCKVPADKRTATFTDQLREATS